MTRLGRGLLVAVVIGLSLPGTGCATTAPPSEPEEVMPPGGETVLPVRWVGRLPFVEALVDGNGPYTFLIDTGAFPAVVGTTIAARHPGGVITLDGVFPLRDSSGRTLNVGEAVNVESLEIGGVRFSGFQALVLDLAFVSDLFGFTVDGALGMSAFPTGLLTLDYPAGQIRFAEGELPEPDGATVLPLASGSGLPKIEFDWAGVPLCLILDSGSNGGFDLPEWPPAAEFLAGPVPGSMAGSVSGVVERDSCARVRGHLAIGRYRMVDPILEVGPGSARVGTEVLSRFRVTLDYAHGRVRFDGDPVEWRMGPFRGTGAAIQPSGGVFRVIDLVPGCPAEEYGLLVGDILVSVEDIPADSEHLTEVFDALKGPSHRVRVQVRRDGRDVVRYVPVVDLVP